VVNDLEGEYDLDSELSCPVASNTLPFRAASVAPRRGRSAMYGISFHNEVDQP
jgi:hypothetical protein